MRGIGSLGYRLALGILLGAAAMPAAWATPVSFNYTGGIVDYTIQQTGTYEFLLYGAQGGASATASGGLGAEIDATFYLTAGTTLSIAVGGQGATGRETTDGGGGGGTFLVLGNTPLLVAGGGGGAGGGAGLPGLAGTPGVGITTSGSDGLSAGNEHTPHRQVPGAGGANGQGGGGAIPYGFAIANHVFYGDLGTSGSGGGAGFFGNGGDGGLFGAFPGQGGADWANGLGGGAGAPNGGGNGGFGGGGGSEAYRGGGGGGGYSGGGGGGGGLNGYDASYIFRGYTSGGGGGGGSYYAAALGQQTLAFADGVRSGNGALGIDFLGARRILYTDTSNFQVLTIADPPPPAVPEPPATLLLGLGAAALAGLRRRQAA
jgi:hypothetical protein